MNVKLEQLNNLNSTLKPPAELGGMFLPPGYAERFDIMFVAKMPSMNEPINASSRETNFNFGITARDRFFQEMMIKYGAAGCYVTDIVKKRDVPRMPTKYEIREWTPFLLKEIEIIGPRAIVVLGQRTYKSSFRPYVEFLISKDIKIDYVFHYSSQVPRSKFEGKFSEVLRKFITKAPA